MLKSVILPGWGQVVNRHVWKVPIIYATLGGLVAYSIFLHKRYHDYRAAFYNSFSENTDQRFGSTPDYLVGQSSTALRFNRNQFRNRRDRAYLFIGLAYGLNILDAYIFAHLKDFDVSDDLSMSPGIEPDLNGALVMRVSFKF